MINLSFVRALLPDCGWSVASLQSECGPRQGRKRRVGFSIMLVVGSMLLASLAAGQSSSTSSEGVDNGNYNYQGSLEFGYRFVDTKASESTYNTFVNQQQGPRVFDQTLSVRSLNHQGILFDNLFVSSFGWGGDPENASRLRISKNKWYNFNLTFRRDQNNWDYNLLANPLNPANSVIQVNGSPHQFQTVRNMQDYGLTLLPQSPVRLRFAYSRNKMEGPSLSSVHEGTDTVMFQKWNTLLNAYQFGVDFKVLPRTNISYDQFLQYYEGDTTWADQSFPFHLSTGTTVDPGIVYSPAVGQPCATPILSTGFYNPACNGYQAYNRSAPSRVSYPTEQLALQSNYFKPLDLSARASYSASDATMNNNLEAFAGLITRSRQRAYAVGGDSQSKRVIANADLGVTIHVTRKFRIVDSFRFSNFRIPGGWSLTNGSLFGATLLSRPNLFSPATCPPPFTAATCPQHNASSGADITNDLMNSFLRQDAKLNTFELEYDVTRRFSGHVGYRFERRSLTNSMYDLQALTFYPSLPNRGACAGQALVNGVCNTTVATTSNESLGADGHSLLFGFSARPTDAFRANFDLELYSADDVFTRIAPRNLQRYKARVGYKPRHWMNLAGTVNILESRNNQTEVLHREHNRNYGFSLMLNPKQRFGLEFGYNYNDVFSTTNICYVATPAPPGALTCGVPYISANSIYDSKVHFGYTNLTFKPVKRVTANLGYNLTSTTGDTLLTGNSPISLGPLAFNFHKPSAALDVDLVKGWVWRTAWGYYGYNEKSDPGVISARDFHSNSATLSLRYAF